MKWRRRRQRPLQATVDRVPRISRCLRTTANALDDHIKEQQLCQTKTKRAHRTKRVEVGELHRVVGITPWHAGKSQKVHWEKSQIEKDHRQPEMPLAELFVVHMVGHLRRQVIRTVKQ